MIPPITHYVESAKAQKVKNCTDNEKSRLVFLKEADPMQLSRYAVAAKALKEVPQDKASGCCNHLFSRTFTHVANDETAYAININSFKKRFNINSKELNAMIDQETGKTNQNFTTFLLKMEQWNALLPKDAPSTEFSSRFIAQLAMQNAPIGNYKKIFLFPVDNKPGNSLDKTQATGGYFYDKENQLDNPLNLINSEPGSLLIVNYQEEKALKGKKQNLTPACLWNNYDELERNQIAVDIIYDGYKAIMNKKQISQDILNAIDPQRVYFERAFTRARDRGLFSTDKPLHSLIKTDETVHGSLILDETNSQLETLITQNQVYCRENGLNPKEVALLFKGEFKGENQYFLIFSNPTVSSISSDNFVNFFTILTERGFVLDEGDFDDLK